MGPTWVLSAPDGPHVGPMNLTIRVSMIYLKVWNVMETPYNTLIEWRQEGFKFHLILSPYSIFLLCGTHIWGLCCQKQVSHAGTSNYIPQFTVGCNYLSLPEIPASGNKVLICSSHQHIKTKQAQVWYFPREIFWIEETWDHVAVPWHWQQVNDLHERITS